MKQYINKISKGLIVAFITFIAIFALNNTNAAAAGKLKAPNITITKSVEKNVSLSWKKINGASRYIIYRKTKKTDDYKLIATTTKLKYTDKKTVKRTTYYYRIYAQSKIKGKYKNGEGKTISAYAMPEKIVTVLAGDSYGVGLQGYAKDILGSGTKFSVKEGLTTDQYLYNNYYYMGASISTTKVYKPDRVYLLFGMNEVIGRSASQITANINKIVKSLKKTNSNMQIIILPVTPTVMYPSGNCATLAKRNATNAAFASYAKKTKNVYYCDYTYVLDTGNGYSSYYYSAGDGYHWKSTTTRNVAKAIVSWTKKNL